MEPRIPMVDEVDEGGEGGLIEQAYGKICSLKIT